MPRVALSSAPASPASGTRAPIRVTHVVLDFEGGGLETLVANMASRWHGTAVQMSMVTLSGRAGRLGSALHDRFDCLEVIRPARGVSLLFPLSVARAITRTRPDVVHIHSGCWLKGARAARLAGVPRVVFTEHGREHDDPRIQRWLDRRAAHYTDAVVAVSERLASYMARVVGIPSTKIRTIHNGVDTSVFTPGSPPPELRASLDIPRGAFVIGSVGRLETVKAYDRLLESAARLRGSLTQPVVVVIWGNGSQREALLARAHDLGLGDCVRLPGWLDQPVRAYRMFDVFALSSVSEGQSVSLMEAMACGIPPVVTNVGSNAEMLGPELSSHVVAFADVDGMAAAFRSVLGDRRRADAASDIVRRRAVELYSLDLMLAQYESLYRS